MIRQVKRRDNFEHFAEKVEFFEVNGKDKAKFLRSYILRQGWNVKDKIQAEHVKRIENVPLIGGLYKRYMDGKLKSTSLEENCCQICYLSPTYISDCGHTYCLPCLVKLDKSKGTLCAVCRKKLLEIFEIKKLLV